MHKIITFEMEVKSKVPLAFPNIKQNKKKNLKKNKTK